MTTPLPEHICHGGTWNNGTKQFECEHTDILPEQGGNNTQELDEILHQLLDSQFNPLKRQETINVAKQAILDLQNKRIEEAHLTGFKNGKWAMEAQMRNMLDRLEQADAKLTDGRHLELDIPSWVEAERNKLKESK